jgi:hypothetical protein
MKRLFLSAFLALTFLAGTARQAQAGGFGFGFGVSGNLCWNASCWQLGYYNPPCNGGPASYGFGPNFAPAYCQYGGNYAQGNYGYPGYPGVAINYAPPAAGYPAMSYPQAMPAPTQPTTPTAMPTSSPFRPVGYYPQAGYGAYAYPAYWYGR